MLTKEDLLILSVFLLPPLILVGLYFLHRPTFLGAVAGGALGFLSICAEDESWIAVYFWMLILGFLGAAITAFICVAV
jgi:hypothetical protein